MAMASRALVPPISPISLTLPDAMVLPCVRSGPHTNADPHGLETPEGMQTLPRLASPRWSGQCRAPFSVPRSFMLVHRLLDEAIVALLSMVALWLIPNKKPPVVFLVVSAAGAPFA